MKDHKKLNAALKNGGGISIVFIHGNSLSVKSFVNQFSDPTLNDYNLMAIDLPGHGDSPTASDLGISYSVPNLALALAEFINRNISSPVVLVGNSLGGNVAIEASVSVNDIRGLVLFGTAPVSCVDDISKGFLPNPVISFAFQDNLNDKIIDQLYKLNHGEDTSHRGMFKTDMHRTDKRFRSSFGSSVAKGEFADEIKILQNSDFPVAVFHAELDRITNLGYIENIEIPNLWKGRIQILKKTHHLLHLLNPQEFNSLLNEFMKIT